MDVNGKKGGLLISFLRGLVEVGFLYNSMSKISAVVLTNNSQDHIEETLSSLEFCKEIIIIDNGSTDDTVKIAKKHKAIVVEDYSKDFSKKRNLAISKAKEEWLLYVDADEIVTEELRRDIENITESDVRFVAFRIKRKNFYLGGNPWPFVEKLERLFKKNSLKKWSGILHESPKVEGEIGELQGLILHYSHKDLSSMLKKTNEWSNMESLLRFNNNHPKMTSWRFFRVFLTGFFEYYVRQGGWKVGTVGIIESIFQGFSLFITYAKLWEMQQKSSN